MKSLIFIDSDILFTFFAINNEKEKNFIKNGTTGDIALDIIIKLIIEIEEKNQIICLSEFSILEIICTLNRLNSSNKIPKILTKLYSICDVLPLNDLMIKLAWFIGSNYNLHSGDALHMSFCLFSDIKEIILKDKEFHDSCIKIKKDFENAGYENLNNFFIGISFIQGIPENILKKYSNLKNLKIKKI